jgi:hypothetical protein
VPVGHRRRVSLDYSYGTRRGPKRSSPPKLSDGVRSAMFVACSRDARPLAPGHPLDRETQFNGGIVTAWRRCLPLDVFVRGGEPPLRVVISMGAGHCRRR